MSKPFVYSLEYYVSLGCNNSCVGCSHGAPINSGLIDVDTYERDLESIKRVLSVHRFALSGGEPLLHPRITELVDIAKYSDLAKEVMVLTNGKLLDEQPEEFWEKLDVLRVSRYPGQLEAAQIMRWKKRARAYGAEFMCLEIGQFYKTLTREERDEASTLSMFQACPYFHKCSAIHDGLYFPCSQAFFVPRLKGWARDVDALSLAKITTERLGEFMQRKEPLRSCAHCAHTTMIPWNQTTRAKWVEESTE